jgi:CspA family cold shock protein
MGFRDQQLVCQQCGKTFFFTVTDQRRLAAELGTDQIVPPSLCPSCRKEQEPAPVARRQSETKRPERAPAPAREQAETSAAPTEEFPLEEQGIQVKLIGAVKWFSLDKGYGFITKADGKDVFFHRSDVVDIQVSSINEGQQVEFQVRRTPKGLEAFNVSALPVP